LDDDASRPIPVGLGDRHRPNRRQSHPRCPPATSQYSRPRQAVPCRRPFPNKASALVQAAGKVIAVERDAKLAHILRAELAEGSNLEIVAGDALELDLASCVAQGGRPLVVMGNLPYVITSPVLFAVLEAAAAGSNRRLAPRPQPRWQAPASREPAARKSFPWQILLAWRTPWPETMPELPEVETVVRSPVTIRRPPGIKTRWPSRSRSAASKQPF
jgi:hypothetical protein